MRNAIVLYEIDPPPVEGDGEGVDHTEWFSSERAARKRLAEMIKELAEYDLVFQTITLRKITVTRNLSTKRLILGILNRSGWQWNNETLVVAEIPDRYRPVELRSNQ